MSLTNKTVLSYVSLIAFGLLSLLLGTSIVTVSISFLDILKVIVNKVMPTPIFENIESMQENIIWNIRLPRVLLAGFVGASLAVVGAAFQGLLRNPLAEPYTLGVSSGASVGAVVTIFFNLSLPVIVSFTLTLLCILASFVIIFLFLYFCCKLYITHLV